MSKPPRKKQKMSSDEDDDNDKDHKPSSWTKKAIANQVKVHATRSVVAKAASRNAVFRTVELLLQVFSSLPALRDLFKLAATCKYFRLVFETHKNILGRRFYWSIRDLAKFRLQTWNPYVPAVLRQLPVYHPFLHAIPYEQRVSAAGPYCVYKAGEFQNRPLDPAIKHDLITQPKCRGVVIRWNTIVIILSANQPPITVRGFHHAGMWQPNGIELGEFVDEIKSLNLDDQHEITFKVIF